jgi:hypothetical protein
VSIEQYEIESLIEMEWGWPQSGIQAKLEGGEVGEPQFQTRLEFVFEEVGVSAVFDIE